MRSWSVLATILAVGLAFPAGEAAAQACIGVPVAGGQSALAGSIGFASFQNIYGAEFHHNLDGNAFTLTGRAQYSDPDFGDGVAGFGGNATYDLGQISDAEELSVCPTGGLLFQSPENGSIISVPVGVGVGADFALSEDEDGFVLSPFGIPAIHYTRISNGSSVSNTDFDITLGATGLFGQFYGTVDISNLIRDGDSVFTLRFGGLF